MPQAAGARRKRSRLLLLAVLATATLLAGELFLRAVDPFSYGEADERKRFGRALTGEGGGRRPGLTTTYLGGAVTTNSRGLRNPEVPLEPPPGVHRVLVLGDSVPFGWGVADGEEFPRVLERLLNAERACAPDRCQVVNGAWPGWGLDHSGKFLVEEGLRYRPDTVLLMLINNDIPRKNAYKPRARFHMPQTQYLPNRLRRAWALRFLDDALAYLLHDEPPADYDPLREADPEGLELALTVLGEIERITRESGAEFVLLDSLRLPEVIAFCDELGVRRIHVGTTPEQVERWKVSDVDLHPNAEAHAWMAGLVLEGLRPLR